MREHQAACAEILRRDRRVEALERLLIQIRVALGGETDGPDEEIVDMAEALHRRLREQIAELAAIDETLGLDGEGRTRWQGQRVAEIRSLKASDRDRTRLLLELDDARAEVAEARRDPLNRIATALETLARVARGVRP